MSTEMLDDNMDGTLQKHLQAEGNLIYMPYKKEQQDKLRA